ncbi:MAG: CbiQ family ECF transporter T component [Galactobacter sp.]|uniref:CbiQ family ECF transporter T component n=1 Tax=Galactobacter sp. TaxID=2676125 RepID=UPI0025C60D88|nr:CbiQ family ECF transporter T component [Galactobacter sp.]
MRVLDPGNIIRSVPGSSLIHRTPLWCKYLVLLAAGVASAFLRTDWRYGVGLLAFSFLVYAFSGARVFRTFLSPLRYWWWVVPLLVAYHWPVNGPWVALAVPSCIYALLTLARLLLITTDQQVLIDGIGRAGRWIGLPRSSVEIALALFLRTLPDVVDSWRRIRESAAARGLRRAPIRTATALVIAAVARARDAGDALSARGLPEPRGSKHD